MDLIKLLDELCAELTDRKGIVKRRVDLKKCCELVDALRSGLPTVFSQAQEIIATRAKILSNADTVAKSIIKEAEIRAKRLACDTAIVKQAERESRDTLNKAYCDCDAIAMKAKQHLDGMFRDAENYFMSMLETIKINRNELSEAFSTKGK